MLSILQMWIRMMIQKMKFATTARSLKWAHNKIFALGEAAPTLVL
jgi:hypothetical protein